MMPSKATASAGIGYLNGSGPRKDWADNDDAVVQSALSTGDTLPPGGTLTGDGLLADGALVFDSVDTTKGNEYIAYNLGGTMEEGETITFSFNLFNHVSYYNEIQAQLWDITASNELAVSAWVITRAWSAADYKPLDGLVSYTATAATAGHQLAIVFREWHNSTARQGYIDNIEVTSSSPKLLAGITNNFSDASSIAGWFNMGTVNATISHLSGAGALKDYWNGDDSTAQPAKTSSESNDVVTAGGTITGDGLLADGALLFDVQDTTKGNEYIAYVLDGVMAEGDVINFSYNDFNNVSYYNMVQGQLWDMTASNQLAVANWVTVLAASAADYRPYNAGVSYVATATEAGHKLAIVFREWGSSTTRDPYIDNIKVTIAADDPNRAYSRWVAGFGLSGPDAAYAMDFDGDGLANLGEYGVGGDPTDPANLGVLPTGSIGEESGTNWFSYTYPRRSDFWLAGLEYATETRTNLLEGADWTNENFGVSGVGETGGSLDYVTNPIPILGESARFARLAIEEPAVRPPASGQVALEQKTTLFNNGSFNTPYYRIPALITATNGDLVAVCDKREDSSDLGSSMDIDIVFRRSTDNGASWSSEGTIAGFGHGHPASDASLVLDRETGEIFCFYNYMDRYNADGEYRFYVQRSTDCGATWGSATDITSQIADSGWGTTDLKFIVSGRGIQLRDGKLLNGLFHGSGLYLFGSADHGASWQRIDVRINPANESKVVELADGAWMVNSRVDYSVGHRWVHRSNDRGQSWESLPDPNLADPGNNASIIRYTLEEDGFAKNRLLFSNTSHSTTRQNLAVRISYDEGKSWSAGKVVETGTSKYSSLTICADGSIGVLYGGDNKVVFARFTLEALTDGKDSLSAP